MHTSELFDSIFNYNLLKYNDYNISVKYRDDKTIELSLEVPGLNRKSLKVDLFPASKLVNISYKKGNTRYDRSYTVDAPFMVENASLTYEDGIIIITLERDSKAVTTLTLAEE